MPIASEVIQTPENFGKHTVTDRRGVSKKQEDTITASEWPVVTRTAYDMLARGVVPEELANLKLRRRCEAKAALGRALTAVQNAMYDVRPTQANRGKPTKDETRAYNRMRSQYEKLTKMLFDFPLTVV